MPLGLGVAALLLAEILLTLFSQGELRATATVSSDTHNTLELGRVLYTDYIYLFQLAGLILLVAMIGAITLTLRKRPGVRRQVIDTQNNRKREDSVAVVQVKSGEGVGGNG